MHTIGLVLQFFLRFIIGLRIIIIITKIIQSS